MDSTCSTRTRTWRPFVTSPNSARWLKGHAPSTPAPPVSHKNRSEDSQVLSTRHRPPLLHSNQALLDSHVRRGAPCDTLERFIQDLNSCDRSVQQIRLTLDAVRETVNADAVYCCSHSPTECVEIAGDQDLPPEWCRQFVRRLLAETPGVDGQLLRSSLPAGPGWATPAP